tara:strand:- start:2055 stop:2213 length:159 start_codon:yes stop_codon:yes gene_type:complete
MGLAPELREIKKRGDSSPAMNGAQGTPPSILPPDQENCLDTRRSESCTKVYL